MTNNLSPAEREFLVQLRSLLLKTVDLIERRAGLGKYKGSISVEISPADSIAWVGGGEPVDVRIEVSDDR